MRCGGAALRSPLACCGQVPPTVAALRSCGDAHGVGDGGAPRAPSRPVQLEQWHLTAGQLLADSGLTVPACIRLARAPQSTARSGASAAPWWSWNLSRCGAAAAAGLRMQPACDQFAGMWSQVLAAPVLVSRASLGLAPRAGLSCRRAPARRMCKPRVRTRAGTHHAPPALLAARRSPSTLKSWRCGWATAPSGRARCWRWMARARWCRCAHGCARALRHTRVHGVCVCMARYMRAVGVASVRVCPCRRQRTDLRACNMVCACCPLT